MKLNPNSTRPQIFEHYEHPWYEHVKHRISDDCPEDMKKPVYNLLLNKPNQPTQQAVDKAQFIDKTYEWNRDNNIRPRSKRSTK